MVGAWRCSNSRRCLNIKFPVFFFVFFLSAQKEEANWSKLLLVELFGDNGFVVDVGNVVRIWVTDVFVNWTSAVNRHGPKGGKSTKRQGRKKKKKPGRFRLWTGFDFGSLSCCLHAAFYNSDLCWANVQIAFLSAIPSFGALQPERSQHNPDLQRHYFPPVTAGCQISLWLWTPLKWGTTAWMADVASLCVPLCQSFQERAHLERVNTCRH